jgi:hypothetical protein
MQLFFDFWVEEVGAYTFILAKVHEGYELVGERRNTFHPYPSISLTEMAVAPNSLSPDLSR